MSKIFISHAVADKALASRLVDFLKEAIGVPGDAIFCSSIADHGIPLGQNFNEYIKSRIEAPKLVILLMTPAYLESRFCLMELGATWSRALDRLPIIVKPVSFDDVTKTLGLVQAWDITDYGGLVQLRQKIRDTGIELEHRGEATWDQKRNAWKSNLRHALKRIIGARMISASALEAATANVKATEADLEQAKAELERAIAERDQNAMEVDRLNKELNGSRKEVRALANAIDSAASYQSRRPTFLLVEPDSRTTTDLRIQLMNNNCDCVGVAVNNTEALQLAAKHRPDFMISEVALPSGPTAGIRTAIHIQQNYGATPIFLTAHPERLLTGERPTPVYLVTKPFTPTSLALEIRRALKDKADVAKARLHST
ncbi:TIR domain-containing protein [Neorhizobium galegae]|uniref:TIR domain-containing protein n=1 Tax=Neorhizobium galegae TaxID=399 RepID=UPI002106AB1A|nr:TIR domain-containing protein [Neorhizobium galegae]MCQ1779114.1 TIR domain-containing protein [Neorhizobium galegae]MCQ1799211.1 TIR domain-containing protein [Neorhizobium galegae]